MEAVFGSMYGKDPVLTGHNVVSILATASLFLMQELIDQCNSMMIETVDKNTAVSYYNALETYGLPSSTREYLKQWLELNLMKCSKEEDFSFLQGIPLELLKDVISSQNFVVDGTDYGSYRLLRKWYSENLFIIPAIVFIETKELKR